MFFPPHHKSINAKPAHSHARSSTSLMKTLKGTLSTPSLVSFFFSFFLYFNMFHARLQQSVWLFSWSGLWEATSETLLSDQMWRPLHGLLCFMFFICSCNFILCFDSYSVPKKEYCVLYVTDVTLTEWEPSTSSSQFLVLDMLPTVLTSTLELYLQ